VNNQAGFLNLDGAEGGIEPPTQGFSDRILQSVNSIINWLSLEGEVKEKKSTVCASVRLL
jgi:hypothetical protein